MPSNCVNIEDIENAVAVQDYTTAFQKLQQMIQLFEQGFNLVESKFVPLQQIDHYTLQSYTRLAAAISNLIIAPGFELAPSHFATMATMNRSIYAIFGISGFRNSDHLIKILNTQMQTTANSARNSQQQCMLKILLLYSLECEINLDFTIFLRQYPTQAAYIYFSLLSSPVVIADIANQKRQVLLSMSDVIREFEVTPQLIYTSLATWMLCSYAHFPEKHAIKKHINHLMVRWLATLKIHNNDKPFIKSNKSKPTLLVMLEQFTSVHAMYRSYAAVIQGLNDKFEVVAMVTRGLIDSTAKALFCKVIEVDNDLQHIAHTINTAKEFKADIIYYPSIGMATWSIILCNLRLAPMQLMTLGHPATSGSAQIDYVIAEESEIRSNQRHDFCEQTVVVPDHTFGNLPPTNSRGYHANIETNPDVIRIAIPARSYKLSHSFIHTLKQIRDRSKRKLEFHFFPNETGLLFDFTRAELFRLLPNAFVYPRVDYDEYCNKLLNQCHIYASSFPFCGANSTYDALNLGLPLITLEDPAGQSYVYDANIIRQLQLPEWLIAKSTDEYIDAVLRLIHNDELRVQLSHTCKQAVAAKQTKNQVESYHTLFAEMVALLFKQHATMPKSDSIISYHQLKQSNNT